MAEARISPFILSSPANLGTLQLDAGHVLRRVVVELFGEPVAEARLRDLAVGVVAVARLAPDLVVDAVAVALELDQRGWFEARISRLRPSY